MKKILITGVSGFIGYHLAKRLLDNYSIIGIDNLNNYYDISLKKDRLKLLEHKNFKFIKGNISNKSFLEKIFKNNKFDMVINLAAQAGVRYSLENPDIYIESNIIGFYNILECCRKYNIKKLIYASSSSVYGETKKQSKEQNKTDKQVSLYAATKKTDEILATTYGKLYNINCTGLRFFTVYGPWGRPDMAYFNFTKKIINKEPINLYNYGKCLRDFTYIDDIVDGIIKIMQKPKTKIYNIGKGNPVKLEEFVNILKKALIKYNLIEEQNIKINLIAPQPGDVSKTYANIEKIKKDFNYTPQTNLEQGIEEFVKWYKEYYKK